MGLKMVLMPKKQGFKKRNSFKGQPWVVYRWRNLNCKIVNGPLQGTRWYSCIPADLCGDFDKLVENDSPFSYYRMSMENQSNIQE